MERIEERLGSFASQIRPYLMIVLVLAAIGLGATVVSLALQTYFGRFPVLVVFGPVLAAIVAIVFALWLGKGGE